MNVVEFAEKHLGQFKEVGKEIKVLKCPFCGRTKNKFYINTENWRFKCHSGSCGESGGELKIKHKFGLKVKFGETLKNSVDSTQDTVLNITSTEQKQFKHLTEDMITWWEKRGISKKTLDFAMVVSRQEPNKKPYIAFPYKQYSELKLMKYRDYGIGKNYKKKVWQHKGGTAILWGIDDIEYGNPVIISEGEPDRLSWIEAGYKNSVSVPFGTSNLQWIDNNIKEIEKMQEIYLCFDDDEAGRKAEKNVISRLSEVVKLKKIIKGTYNDINDVLISEGKDKLVQMYEHAEDYKTEGSTDAGEVDIETDLPEYTGLFPEVDKSVGGFLFGEVVIWSAYTGCGKTTLLIQKALKDMQQGFNVCYYSGENSKEDLQLNLALQMYGESGIKKKYYRATQREEIFPTEETNKKLKEVLKGRMIYIQDENIITGEELKDKMLNLLRKNNCRIFYIDNLMQLDFSKESYSNTNEQQKKLVRELVRFANKYNIQIHLVAHNKKPEGSQSKGKTYDVAGSSNIVNLAHMVLSIDRITEKEKQEIEEKSGINADGRIRVLKKRKRFGTGKDVFLVFDNKFQAFYDLSMKCFEKVSIKPKESFFYTDKDIPEF